MNMESNEQENERKTDTTNKRNWLSHLKISQKKRRKKKKRNKPSIYVAFLGVAYSIFE